MKRMMDWDVLKPYSDVRLVAAFSTVGLMVSLSVFRFADAWAANMAYTWMSVVS